MDAELKISPQAEAGVRFIEAIVEADIETGDTEALARIARRYILLLREAQRQWEQLDALRKILTEGANHE